MSSSAKLLLKILSEMDSPIHGRTRLQKIVFILRSRFGKFRDYSFSLYYYGPFSTDLAKVLDDLLMEGLVKEKPVELGDLTRFDISITREGRESVPSSLAAAGPTLISQMVGVAQRLNNSGLESVIAQAYATAAREGL